MSSKTPYEIRRELIQEARLILQAKANKPEYMPTAEEVIEEFAGFPNMEHDDLVDSTTQALLRFRQGGFIPIQSDEEDEPLEHNRIAAYY